MADQLDEIKQKIDLVSYIAETIPLKKAGRNFKGLCPFHGEKTPSFVVSPERQIWHCFGCQKGGDVFAFLMQMDNLEFPEALEILAKRAGVKLVRNFQVSENGKLKDKIYQINHLASEFYHYLLLNHQSGKQALDYILGRGVSRKSLETFSLGWAPNMWDGLMKFLTKKGYTIGEMEQAGLIIRKTRHPEFSSGSKILKQVQYDNDQFYDRFRARLMFTLRDQRSNAVGFSGRILEANPDQAKYINTSETPVYIKGNVLYGLDVTKEAIKKEDAAIVVEGELDLISSFQAGVSNVVAIKGSALTEGQVQLLKRYTQNLILALDMDSAGLAASRRGIEIADNAGFSIKVVKLAEGKDPDECARLNPAAWKKAVKEALPVFDYFLDVSLNHFDSKTAEGKKKISDDVLPILTKIQNPIVQAHYLNQLAKVLAVSEEAISKTMQKFVKSEKTGIVSEDNFSGQALKNLPERLEEHLLALFLQRDDQNQLPLILEMQKFVIGIAVQKILKLLEAGSIKDFPAELLSVADQAYLEDLSEILEDSSLYERELEKTIFTIKKNFYQKKIQELAQKMKEAKTEDEEKNLSLAYRDVSEELKKYNK